jgi:catalase
MMPQARLISYPDAHRYRLGVNFEALPVNRLCPAHTYNRDGLMHADDNDGVSPNVNPTASAELWMTRAIASYPTAFPAA